MSPTLSSASRPGRGEFLERHAAFGLQADVDDGEVLLDGDDGALDDGAFLQIALVERLVEQGGEIFARGRGWQLSH